MLKSEVFRAIRETFTTREEMCRAYSAIAQTTDKYIDVLHWAYNASAVQIARYLGDHFSQVDDKFRINTWAEMNAREKIEVVDGKTLSIDPHNNHGRLCCQPYDATNRLWCVLTYLGKGEYALFNFTTGEYRVAHLDTMTGLY